MHPRGHKHFRTSAWSLALLMLVTGFTVHAGPPRSAVPPPGKSPTYGERDAKNPPVLTLPGRAADSKEPWGAFLGKAAHIAIAIAYRSEHPEHVVFSDTISIATIVKRGRIGDVSRLKGDERERRPDITDVTDRVLFEVKPANAEGLAAGREQARQYLHALNRALTSGKQFEGGTGLQGTLVSRFEGGGFIWVLLWYTPEPGVTLYRWLRSKDTAQPLVEVVQAALWEELPTHQSHVHERLLLEVLEAHLDGREYPADFNGELLWVPTCQ